MKQYGNKVQTALTDNQKKSLKKQKRQLSESERHDRLQEIVDDYYESAEHVIKPVFPYILCRVLPKWMKQGLLYIPDNTKKVLHEAVVLDVYNEHWQARKTTVGGVETEDSILHKPSVKIGDHIIFQYFEGIPVEHKLLGTAYVKAQTYVMIPDNPIGNGRNGILGIVEGAIDVKALVEEFLDDANDLSNAYTDAEIAEMLMKKFVISPADQESATHSLINVK